MAFPLPGGIVNNIDKNTTQSSLFGIQSDFQDFENLSDPEYSHKSDGQDFMNNPETLLQHDVQHPVKAKLDFTSAKKCVGMDDCREVKNKHVVCAPNVNRCICLGGVSGDTEPQNDDGVCLEPNTNVNPTASDKDKLPPPSMQKPRNKDYSVAKNCEKATDCLRKKHTKVHTVSCIKVSVHKLKKCVCTGEESGEIEPMTEDGDCIKQGVSSNIGEPKRGEPVFDHADIERISSHNKKALGQTEGNAMPRREGDMANMDQALLVLKIILPILAVAVIVLIILLIMKRRGVGLFKTAAKPGISNSSSQVVWLSRNPDNSLLLDSMSLVNKNPTYYAHQPEFVITKYSDKEIPPENIALKEEIGEGAFGQVFRGDLLGDDGVQQPVAIKLLKNGVSLEIKEDFEREVEIMSTFDHDNILKLLGVVTKEVEETPFMVFEFMEFGDLAGLLRKNDPVLRRTKDCAVILKETDLVDISVQIANGMEYLTQQHFVHRDLATRNCLVGEGLLVKISDFGMSRDIYTCDYYKIGGSRMLPVRWMSPESVKYGKFTSESDVWSYGVVLWEIFSFGKQPYYGHTNEEVVSFIENHTLLSKPESCPSSIFDVMLQGWRTDPDERISFEDIHAQLVDHSKRMVKQLHKVSHNKVAQNGHCATMSV